MFANDNEIESIINTENQFFGEFRVENPQFTVVTNQLDIDNTDSFTLDVTIRSSNLKTL